MRTNNPVLSRPDAFTPGHQRYGSAQDYQANPAAAHYNPNTIDGDILFASAERPFSESHTSTGRMTLDDVIAKTTILLVAVIAAAAIAWFFLPLGLLLPVAVVGSIVVAVTVMVMAVKRHLSVPLLGAYAVMEGLVIGSWSKILNYSYPGIVPQAVLATFVTAAMILAVYKFGGVRVRGRLAQTVTAGIIAYAVLALINLVLAIFHVDLGLFSLGAQAGPLSWMVSLLGVALACASLMMDFDAIDHGIRMGAPAEESWRAAFGLVVTLIWLYTLLLRVLSYFRQN